MTRRDLQHVATRFRLPPSPRDPCLVMGVLNVTPDSFSDGGRYVRLDAALRHAARMVREGADIIDVGGESTRPGARLVGVAEELDRIIPVIEALRREVDCAISIDTSKTPVMSAAVAAGADMINDVMALRADGALECAAGTGVAVCLMHMQGSPATMQDAPAYGDVVTEVSAWLQERVDRCIEAGIGRDRLCIDPGFGFGKSLEHNLGLLRGLGHIASLGLPVLVGLSRKSMIGRLLDRDVGQRAPGGLALALLARQRGASLIRTHDVAPTVDALRILAIVNDESESDG